MNYFVNKKDVDGTPMEGHVSFRLLDDSHGCVKGFCSGITTYTTSDYPTPGVHDDQEGFVVMEGTGWAKVGGQEYRLEPEVCFVAPAGIEHSIKKDPDSEHIKVCWFHGAI